MPFTAALSEHPVPAEAVGEVLGQVLEAVGPQPDLAVLFATAPLTGALEDVVSAVHAVLRPRAVLGSTAVSVVGRAQEVEDTTALTLWAGSTGPVTPVRLEVHPVDGGASITGLPVAGDTSAGDTLLLVADPFSFPVDGFLDQLAADRPDLTVVGGLASAARGPGGNRLVLDDALHDDGAIGVLVDAAHPVATVVSQGCRPVGEPMIVTRSERTMLYELAGKPALAQVMAMAESSPPDERALMQHGLHLGVVVDEQRPEFGRGDFLVRNVLGADRDNGAVAVSDEVEVGRTVQFQVRDAASADDDLRTLLAEAGDADGALVFTCNGRGTNLFGTPNHDADLVAATTRGNCAGMFCAGEVGPIGGRSFLHGFTASIALFRD